MAPEGPWLAISKHANGSWGVRSREVGVQNAQIALGSSIQQSEDEQACASGNVDLAVCDDRGKEFYGGAIGEGSRPFGAWFES